MSAAPPSVIAALPCRDAKLIGLGHALRQAWAEENEAWALAEDEEDDDGPKTLRASRLTKVTAAIAREAVRYQATTLAGVLVKVTALAWCRSGDPWEVEDVNPFGFPSTSTAVLAGLLNDLQAMRGAGA